MFLHTYNNSLELVAEDAVEVAYLQHIFAGEISVNQTTQKILNGFYETGEVKFFVTLEKAS